MQVGIVITCIALFMLLIAEWRAHKLGIWFAKPAASLGFLLAAMHAPALQSTFGRSVFIALLLSYAGDVLLIPKAPVWFLCGLGSFLLAHVAFTAAFAQQGIVWGLVAGTAAVMAAIAWTVWRWLGARVPPPMRGAVMAYMATISVMMMLAVGSAPGSPQPITQVLAATLFYASDIMVAKQQFVGKNFGNKLVGLPLYYAAQLCMAHLLYY